MIAFHVAPLSVVRASWPRAPSASAISGAGPSRRPNWNEPCDVPADRQVVLAAVVGDDGGAAGPERDRARDVEEARRVDRRGARRDRRGGRPAVLGAQELVARARGEQADVVGRAADAGDAAARGAAAPMPARAAVGGGQERVRAEGVERGRADHVHAGDAAAFDCAHRRPRRARVRGLEGRVGAVEEDDAGVGGGEDRVGGRALTARGAGRRAGDRGAATERRAAVRGAQHVAVAQQQIADRGGDEVRGRHRVRAVGLGQHEHLVEGRAAVVGAADHAAVAAEDHDDVRRDRL